jgi:hypothetical protein
MFRMVTGLHNRTVKIEPPHSNKTNIIQCTRWQWYSHTKTYCNTTYVCVKCGSLHNTTDGKKTRETPARRALCRGNHPANYRRCEHYRKLTKGTNRNFFQKNPTSIYTNEFYARNIQPSEMTLPRSYADIAKLNLTQSEETTNILATFLDKFKNIFNNYCNKYYGAKYANNACQQNEINCQISKNSPMKCQWTTKSSRINKNISKHKCNRYSVNQGNPLYQQKLHLYSELQILPDKPPRRHCSWRLSNTNQRRNQTL